MGRRMIAVLLSASVFALAGFFLACLTAPVWEARATLALDCPEALAALPGILAGEGASAHAIPGTDVLELALRADAPAPALEKLDALLAQIPGFLHYLALSPEFHTLATATRQLSLPQPGLYALSGGLLGALAAVLWMIPTPNTREPMALGEFLAALGRRACRRSIPMLLTVFLLAGGNALRVLCTATPQYTAEALIRVGEYDPATADGLAGTVLGLASSQLAAPEVTVQQVGSTNLFRLSSVSGSERVALSRMDDFLEGLPRLLSHISGEPEFVVLEEPQVLGPETPSPLRAALTGGAIGTALWLAILTGQALKKQGLYSGG